jgi:hypothetical protein
MQQNIGELAVFFPGTYCYGYETGASYKGNISWMPKDWDPCTPMYKACTESCGAADIVPYPTVRHEISPSDQQTRTYRAKRRHSVAENVRSNKRQQIEGGRKQSLIQQREQSRDVNDAVWVPTSVAQATIPRHAAMFPQSVKNPDQLGLSMLPPNQVL